MDKDIQIVDVNGPERESDEFKKATTDFFVEIY